VTVDEDAATRSSLAGCLGVIVLLCAGVVVLHYLGGHILGMTAVAVGGLGLAAAIAINSVALARFVVPLTLLAVTVGVELQFFTGLRLVATIVLCVTIGALVPATYLMNRRPPPQTPTSGPGLAVAAVVGVTLTMFGFGLAGYMVKGEPGYVRRYGQPVQVSLPAPCRTGITLDHRTPQVDCPDATWHVRGRTVTGHLTGTFAGDDAARATDQGVTSGYALGDRAYTVDIAHDMGPIAALGGTSRWWMVPLPVVLLALLVVDRLRRRSRTPADEEHEY